MKNKLPKILLLFISLSVLLFSCKTPPVYEPKVPSAYIADKGVFTANELADFFLMQNPDYPEDEIKYMAQLYVSECAMEGINSDVAFAQMCLETGYLRFGNLVTPDMHNYCGLGAIDAAHPGERFDTVQLGIRAHVQHLHAYGTTAEVKLNNPLIDNRYKWVNPRGKAPTFYELAGTWAADRAYGTKIEAILQKLTLLQTGR